MKILTEQNAKILITEVNFKNNEDDFVKIYYYSPSNKQINLKSLQFQDDKVFKTITNDFFINSGDYLTLTFNDNSKDNEKSLFTNSKGLTGTTEQIIIKDQDGKILDAVCWSSKKPTEKEIKDLVEIFKSQKWNSDDPKSCIESEKIAKNISITRKNTTTDTDSKNDWEYIQTETKSSKKSKKKAIYQNGDISSEIIINEIYPNPDTKISKEEWIELYNKSNENINLGNWQLDDDENGSKPYIFSDKTIIKAKNFIVVKSTESKISLNNSKDQVRLFDYNKNLISQIDYEDVPKQKSFGLIKIKKEDSMIEEKWSFEKPTQGKENSFYQEFTGNILQDATFENNYSFLFEDRNKNQKQIIFEEKLIPATLAQTTFTQNTKIKIQIDEVNLLKNYEVLAKPPLKESNFSGIIPILLVIGIIIYLLKIKNKCKAPES